MGNIGFHIAQYYLSILQMLARRHNHWRHWVRLPGGSGLSIVVTQADHWPWLPRLPRRQDQCRLAVAGRSLDLKLSKSNDFTTNESLLLGLGVTGCGPGGRRPPGARPAPSPSPAGGPGHPAPRRVLSLVPGPCNTARPQLRSLPGPATQASGSASDWISHSLAGPVSGCSESAQSPSLQGSPRVVGVNKPVRQPLCDAKSHFNRTSRSFIRLVINCCQF